MVKAEILKSETLKWRGRIRPRFSIQPVFKPQAGDLGEVHGVASEECGVVGDGDAGNFQVHGADAESALLKLAKQYCRFLIERKDEPVDKQIDLLLLPRIDRDLPVRIIGAVEQCQPTAQVLLDGDDGRGQRVGLILRRVRRSRPAAEFSSSSARWLVSSTFTVFKRGLAFAILPA
jgi:hypothetical protein